METINQKNENRYSINFVRTRSVIEKPMPISEITMYDEGMCKNKKLSVCLISKKS